MSDDPTLDLMAEMRRLEDWCGRVTCPQADVWNAVLARLRTLRGMVLALSQSEGDVPW